MRSQGQAISRKDDLIVKEVEGEVLIYDLKTDKAFCLNETSARVWHLCDGTRNRSEITQQLSQSLSQPVEEGLVALALDQFEKENLLHAGQQAGNKFGGLSRREVVRRIGLGSMLALPVISSLVVPTAASAGSLNCSLQPIPCGCPCSLNNSSCAGCVCNTIVGLCQ